jgi:hypothetical protein
VSQDLLYHWLLQDGGDDLELPGAGIRAVVHVDVEHRLVQPGPVDAARAGRGVFKLALTGRGNSAASRRMNSSGLDTRGLVLPPRHGVASFDSSKDVLPGVRSEGDAVSDGRRLQPPRVPDWSPLGVGLGKAGLAHLLDQDAPAREQVCQPLDDHLQRQVQFLIGGRALIDEGRRAIGGAPLPQADGA